MAALTRKQITRAGVDVTTLAAAAAGGDTFANDGNTYFRVKNAHATESRTVTFASQVASPGQGAAASDKAVVVPALKEYLVGPWDPAVWNNAAAAVEVTYSSEADLTVQAVQG